MVNRWMTVWAILAMAVVFPLSSDGAIWYVNDTHASSTDSFTTVGGADTSGGTGARTAPFRSVAKALQSAMSGDTVYVDAGYYGDTYAIVSAGSETAAFKIDTHPLWIIGRDSGSTVIDPPGARTLPGLYGIYAANRWRIHLRNLAVTGAYTGIVFNNVETSVIAGDSVEGCGGYGISIAGSNNVIAANWLTGNESAGLAIHSGNRNNVHANRVRWNTRSGLLLGSADTNWFYQNEIVGSETGVWIVSHARGNVFGRNNIHNHSVNNFFNRGGAPQALIRNWWGTTDQTVFFRKFRDTASPINIAYRTGPVDSAAGGDSTAPLPPSNILLRRNSSQQVVLVWTNPTRDEENTVLSGFGGVRIYKLLVRDTSDWVLAKVAEVASSETSWTDTASTSGILPFYRLTSFDTWRVPNESLLTDRLSSETGAPTAFVRFGAANPPPHPVFGLVLDRPVLHLVVYPQSNAALSSLRVTTGGTGNDLTALSSIKLWLDGEGDGTGDTLLGSDMVTSDDGSVTFADLGIGLTKNRPIYFVVTFSFAGTPTAGQTFFARIASASDISGTLNATPVRFVGLPLTGAILTALSAANTAPSAPSLSSPSDGATGVATTADLSVSGFSDAADGDSHCMTHWQVVDTTAQYDNERMRVNFVARAETAGLKLRLPRGLMKGGRKWYWRARFGDCRGAFSAWSTVRSFTTAADTFEIATPVAQKAETNPHARVQKPTTFKCVGGSGDEKFSSMGGVKFSDEVNDTGARLYPEEKFKLGLFTFTVDSVPVGGTVTITFDIPEAVSSAAKYVIWDASQGWIDMSADVTKVADTQYTLTLTDGGAGDLDGVANGTVVDPGGFVDDDAVSASGIAFPGSCLISSAIRSPDILAALRAARDIALQSALGRMAAHFYYRW